MMILIHLRRLIGHGIGGSFSSAVEPPVPSRGASSSGGSQYTAEETL
jgi:hypothetical protein